MGNFQVTTQLLNDKADTIKTVNGEFQQTMESISTLIHSLQDEWKSDASNEFVQKFDTLKKEFTNYYQVVNSYEVFLRNAAEDYVAAETKIQSGIAQ